MTGLALDLEFLEGWVLVTFFVIWSVSFNSVFAGETFLIYIIIRLKNDSTSAITFALL